MTRTREGVAVALALVAVMVLSAVAVPILSSGFGPFDDETEGDADGNALADADDEEVFADATADETDDASSTESANDAAATEATDAAGPAEYEVLALEEPASAPDSTAAEADAQPQPALAQDRQDAVEAGVEDGIELAQSQGVEVTQEQRAAALEGATASVAQHQDADVEQVQAATAGAVHGSVMQEQDVNATQIQSAVAGATDGALAQHQTVDASQLQSATWGATHGAMAKAQAQSQRVTVEQIQVATYGAAAGAASEAGDRDVDRAPKIQEAAQGAAYGSLDQYQKLTAEQRQRVTLEHVQHAAAGASAGALEGSTEAALEQEQRVDVEQEQRIDVEQRQRVDIKQIQKAATGAAKGALEQRQEVSVEQTQSAARGAGAGSLKQVQTVSVEQIQRISITQIQEAAFGASKGAIEAEQSQEATVEQLQAAADGAAQGSLVQRQEVSITQIQHAATGSATGAVDSAVQNQIVEVEQIQAAARGAGEGAVTQTQLVDVTQVQTLAQGGSSGALSQSQEASVTQIQTAARSACEETARVVQNQRISITQLQTLTQETAADATQYAVSEGIDDPIEIVQRVEIEVVQRIEQVDELEGTATIDFPDQESDGERVVVDGVELSEGGFVAIYEGVTVDADPGAVVGVSEYLEAGEHEALEIELEDPLEESQALVAAVHHDTNDDGTFDYVETDGAEDEPYVADGGGPVLDGAFVTVAQEEPEATLEVADQAGDGETLVVDEANASTDYVVSAEYDGERIDSDAFAAGDAAEDLELDLEPPLEENATVDVSVRDAGTDAELASESIEYTLEDDAEPGPDATLEVSDQAGDGETLLVDAANASVEYALTVTDEDGEQRAETEPFAAGQAVENESVDLEPPLEENATLEVAVVSAADDEAGQFDADETDADAAGDDPTDNETLASETIEYTVDEAFEELSVEYDSCQRLEITGTLEEGDSLYPRSIWYDANGPGDSFYTGVTAGEEVEAPFTGTVVMEVGEEHSVEQVDEETVVVEVPDDGDFGIGSYLYPWFNPADGVESTLASPPAEFDCGEQIRPDPPTLSVENVEPVENGTTDEGADDAGAAPGPFEVTFGYENPNDAPLTGGDFVEGTTDEEPPEEIEPGEGEFTVEWTPESDDERLAWEIPMDAGFAYDEPARAETEPAGEYDETPEFDVEFDCTTATVEGSFEDGDTVIVATGFYTSGGFGNSMGEYAVQVGDDVDPFEGTIEIETGDDYTVAETDEGAAVTVPESEFGAAITGVVSPDAIPGEIDYPNPNASECLEQVRPEQPEIGVAETTPLEDGDAIEVTFEYENPNNGTMAFGSEFVEGTTDDEPISGMEPGEGEFTVEWTPETDDERLVWEVDLSNYDYDEPLTAATEPAGEIDPGEPAAFEPTIVGTNDPVEQGAPLEVDAEIENVGDETGEQEVTLALDGVEVDAELVTLEGGATETVTLTAATDDLEPGDYAATVETANATVETTVTIEESGEPAEFVVSDLSAPPTAPEGDEVTVAATIANAGDLAGTQTVTYSVDGTVVDETDLQLEGGETASVSFETALPAGESTHAIETDDDSASVSIEAIAEPEPPEPPESPEPPEEPESPEPPELPDDTDAETDPGPAETESPPETDESPGATEPEPAEPPAESDADGPAPADTETNETATG